MDYGKHLWKKSVDYIFRKKSLKSCLYILIAFALTELTAIGIGEPVVEFCDKLKDKHPDDVWYLVATVVDWLYGSGSWWVLSITFVLILIVAYLIYHENDSNKGNGAGWDTIEW